MHDLCILETSGYSLEFAAIISLYDGKAYRNVCHYSYSKILAGEKREYNEY